MTEAFGGAPKGAVWLASYPKSGNTWIRALLSNYVSGLSVPVNINRLLGKPMAASRSLFDQYAAVAASDLTADEIDVYRPEVYRAMVQAASGLVYVKVHDAYRMNVNRLPLFPPDITHAAIYVLRDPRDVAISMAHHWDLTIDAAVEKMCSPDAVFAPARGGSFAQVPQVVGSWTENVVSWHRPHAITIAHFRYEDVLDRPVEQFARMLGALALPIHDERVRLAVEFSQLRGLQSQEETHGFAERRGKEPFFRAGRAGGWRDRLTQSQVNRIESCHREQMLQWGYL